jgi:hypothetical protein
MTPDNGARMFIGDVSNRVQILCAVASNSTATLKLMGISDNEVIDLSESRLCGVVMEMGQQSLY